jgi:O-acetyl-ADP-ribose deacetylase (regulator of RNase III)
MKIIKGDIITLAEEGNFDIIVQGCNCFHTQASGLAGQLVKKYPQVLEVDRATPYGDPNKLGTFSIAETEKFSIMNIYTQFHFGLNEDLFEYDAFQTFLNNWCTVLQQVKTKNKPRIGFPMIGCGLAGGNPEVIMKMIEDFAEKVKNHAVVMLVQLS